MIRWVVLFILAASTVLAEVPDSFYTGVVEDHFDRIEVNHFVDDYGRVTFDQIIFFDWNPDKRTYVVEAWRLIGDGRASPTSERYKAAKEAFDKDLAEWKKSLVKRKIVQDERDIPDQITPKFSAPWVGTRMMPRKNYNTGLYETMFNDKGVLRRITAYSVSETTTQYDVEQVNRKIWKDTRRRDLTKPYEAKIPTPPPTVPPTTDSSY